MRQTRADPRCWDTTAVAGKRTPRRGRRRRSCCHRLRMAIYAVHRVGSCGRSAAAVQPLVPKLLDPVFVRFVSIATPEEAEERRRIAEPRSAEVWVVPESRCSLSHCRSAALWRILTGPHVSQPLLPLLPQPPASHWMRLQPRPLANTAVCASQARRGHAAESAPASPNDDCKLSDTNSTDTKHTHRGIKGCGSGRPQGTTTCVSVLCAVVRTLYGFSPV